MTNGSRRKTARLVALDDDDREWLRTRAEFEGTSMAAILRRAMKRERREKGEVGTWK